MDSRRLSRYLTPIANFSRVIYFFFVNKTEALLWCCSLAASTIKPSPRIMPDRIIYADTLMHLQMNCVIRNVNHHQHAATATFLCCRFFGSSSFSFFFFILDIRWFFVLSIEQQRSLLEDPPRLNWIIQISGTNCLSILSRLQKFLVLHFNI